MWFGIYGPPLTKSIFKTFVQCTCRSTLCSRCHSESEGATSAGIRTYGQSTSSQSSMPQKSYVLQTSFQVAQVYTVKLWSNRVPKLLHSKLETCGNLQFHLATTYVHLGWLAITGQAHIHKQVVWPPNASRRKFIVSVLHVHKPALKWLFCDLHLLAIPFGHPLQVCVCKLAFPNLWLWLTRALWTLFSLLQAWECKEKNWVPKRNQTHGIQYSGLLDKTFFHPC